ncbi:MAG TPA: sulfurtransferase TusA family protein [Phycicoccus sp.]|nr:sulfurtransferase TusA family protein [Phycicoccus sp.]
MSAPAVVDARGDRCPLPVVKAARATRDLPHGATVLLLCDDPVARVDVPAWAWLRGHAVEVAEAEGWTVYTVRVGCAEPEPEPEPGSEGGGTAAARST